MNELFLETARYLGYKGNEPDSIVSDMINECLLTVKEKSDFRASYKTFSLLLDGNNINIGGTEIESKTLSFHLKDCHSAYLVCATLGAEIDRLLLKYSVSDIAKCSVLQAAASAYLEDLLDELCDNLSLVEKEKGNALHTRYSAGYGDFSLLHQKDILSQLGASKIGVGTTDACALTPSKSVTAVIGIYRN